MAFLSEGVKSPCLRGVKIPFFVQGVEKNKNVSYLGDIFLFTKRSILQLKINLQGNSTPLKMNISSKNVLVQNIYYIPEYCY